MLRDVLDYINLDSASFRVLLNPQLFPKPQTLRFILFLRPTHRQHTIPIHCMIFILSQRPNHHVPPSCSIATFTKQHRPSTLPFCWIPMMSPIHVGWSRIPCLMILLCWYPRRIKLFPFQTRVSRGRPILKNIRSRIQMACGLTRLTRGSWTGWE